MWGSDCDAIRLRLALMAGHDLPRSEETEVERHLVECVDCRRHWAALGQSQYVLEQARVLSATASMSAAGEESVWSGVSREMARLDGRRSERRRNWRSLLPAGAVAAACLTVGIIVGDLWFVAGAPGVGGGDMAGGGRTGQALLSPQGSTPNLPVGNMPRPATRSDAEWPGRGGPVDPLQPRASGPYRNY